MKTGDRVVCIDDSVGKRWGGLELIKDKVYTIKRMDEFNGGRYLDIGLKYNWIDARFRKIDEQKLSNATTKELAGWAKEHVEQERTPAKIRIFTTSADF